ncbi:hypothetical protein LWI29_010017 [Acer saccharum]|uniref:Uncharacterized protein n=1 Tax=Acer saccharum TaxID=4024 RepID=A0AA39VRF6_ACESA|nr:hypothetical protein LWI29_010017 [Acer saccharum]
MQLKIIFWLFLQHTAHYRLSVNKPENSSSFLHFSDSTLQRLKSVDSLKSVCEMITSSGSGFAAIANG